MEKNQYDLCIEVLRRLEKSGVLKDVILIGSWCVHFYKEYFKNERYSGAIKTRDVDLLFPALSTNRIRIDVPNLLRDLGFIVGFKGLEGYIQLEHPDLIIEFLVPEKGRGSNKPWPLPQFGVNAQALRFLDLLTQDTVKLKIDGIEVRLPHPANFALQKLIISQRRAIEEKRKKDKDSAIKILRALISKDEATTVRRVFDSLDPKWQKKVMTGLEEAKEGDVLKILR